MPLTVKDAATGANIPIGTITIGGEEFQALILATADGQPLSGSNRLPVDSQLGTSDLVIGRVHMESRPAHRRHLDSIAVAPMSRTIMDGLAERPALRTHTLKSTTDSSDIAPAPGASLRLNIHQLFILAPGGDNTITLEDSDGADVLGPFPVTADKGFVLPFSPMGWLPDLSANTSLRAVQANATSVMYLVGHSASEV